MQFNTFSSGIYVPPKLLGPSDKELYQAEAEVIELIAKERSAVIIGRCGSYILQDHPNHTRIFLHGDTESRKIRTKKLYHVSEEETERMMAQSDKERAQHWKSFTGEDWADARNYDLTIDTSKIELDNCVELIMNYLKVVGSR
jgi:cytidylate kinase